MTRIKRVTLKLTEAEAERVLELVDPTKGRRAVTVEEHKADLRVVQKTRTALRPREFGGSDGPGMQDPHRHGELEMSAPLFANVVQMLEDARREGAEGLVARVVEELEDRAEKIDAFEVTVDATYHRGRAIALRFAASLLRDRVGEDG